VFPLESGASLEFDGRDRVGGKSSLFIRRNEEKYELGVAAAMFLRDEIAAHLPLFEYRAGYPYTLVTTVYFDTEDKLLYRRAARSFDDNQKIRLKEYFYQQRGGGEGYLTSPHCFVELKERRQGTVYKRRIAIPRCHLREFFRGEDVWPIVESASELFGARGCVRTAYGDLREFLGLRRVTPASAINYRRLVYQLDQERLRVTFDDRIASYPPSPEWRLDSRPTGENGSSPNGFGTPPWNDALTPEALGCPIRTYDKVIVEIKCTDEEYPAWLQRALRNHSSRQVSKFTSSVSSVVRREWLDSRRDGRSVHRTRLSPGKGSPSDDTEFLTQVTDN